MKIIDLSFNFIKIILFIIIKGIIINNIKYISNCILLFIGAYFFNLTIIITFIFIFIYTNICI